jgi:hypothetical protein
MYTPTPGRLQQIRWLGEADGQAVVNIQHVATTLSDPATMPTSTSIMSSLLTNWWLGASGIRARLSDRYRLNALEMWEVTGWVSPFPGPYPPFTFGASDQTVPAPGTTTGAVAGAPNASFVAVGLGYRGNSDTTPVSRTMKGGNRYGPIAEDATDNVGGGNALSAGELIVWQATADNFLVPLVIAPSAVPWKLTIAPRKVAFPALTPFQQRGVALSVRLNRFVTSQVTRKRRDRLA